MLRKINFLLVFTMGFIYACAPGTDTSSEENTTSMQIEKEAFGQTPDGPADLYTLTNANGMTAKITNYGGIVTHLTAPDKDGNYADVVLGFDSLDPYLKGHPYFGAIIGRYGNRIGKGQFTLDGETYQLAQNNGVNHLHGGVKGFDKVLWAGKSIETEDGVGVELTYTSKDMEEGYPGNLSMTVKYVLTNDDALEISYTATTDKKTVCNLTNHTYFNLKGAGNGDILGHELMINADRYTPVDTTLIPTGELAPVEGTPFDFRTPTTIGARVDAEDQQIKNGLGYDHNFVLNRSGEGLQLAATVYEPASGRMMEVLTEEPGVQFYCGNFLDGSAVGKGNKPYNYRYGFCLETQHYPDSPNQPNFPSVVLEPGQTYQTSTVYKFSVKDGE